jgi:hypothetical protein
LQVVRFHELHDTSLSVHSDGCLVQH